MKCLLCGYPMTGEYHLSDHCLNRSAEKEVETSTSETSSTEHSPSRVLTDEEFYIIMNKVVDREIDNLPKKYSGADVRFAIDETERAVLAKVEKMIDELGEVRGEDNSLISVTFSRILELIQ